MDADLKKSEMEDNLKKFNNERQSDISPKYKLNLLRMERNTTSNFSKVKTTSVEDDLSGN